MAQLVAAQNPLCSQLTNPVASIGDVTLRTLFGRNVPEVAVGFTECSTCDLPSACQSFRCAATALFVGAHPTPEKTKTRDQP